MGLGLTELLIVFCICGLLGLFVIVRVVAVWTLFIWSKPGKQT